MNLYNSYKAGPIFKPVSQTIMYRVGYILVAILLSLGLLHCKSRQQKHYIQQRQTQQLFLRIGESGGVVGTENAYILHETGLCFHTIRDNTTDTVAQGRLSPKLTQSIFSDFNARGLKHIAYKKPGNFVQFIEYEENGKGNERIRIEWTPGDTEAPKQAVEFFKKSVLLFKNSVK